jgi:hypothetical protein
MAKKKKAPKSALSHEPYPKVPCPKDLCPGETCPEEAYPAEPCPKESCLEEPHPKKSLPESTPCPALIMERIILPCSSFSLGGKISLPDVDTNTGHVLVHYLYTSTYQTLCNKDISPSEEINIEFK